MTKSPGGGWHKKEEVDTLVWCSVNLDGDNKLMMSYETKWTEDASGRLRTVLESHPKR